MLYLGKQRFVLPKTQGLRFFHEFPDLDVSILTLNLFNYFVIFGFAVFEMGKPKCECYVDK
jgi:hypothetical protein